MKKGACKGDEALVGIVERDSKRERTGHSGARGFVQWHLREFDG